MILAARAWLDRRDLAHVGQRHPDLDVAALQNASVGDGAQRALGHGQGADLLVELRRGLHRSLEVALVQQRLRFREPPLSGEDQVCTAPADAIQRVRGRPFRMSVAIHVCSRSIIARAARG